MINKKTISLFEISMMLLSYIAFSYLMADIVTQNVSASDFVPTGCCMEAKNGAICQNMPLDESSSCKAGLVGTSCETVSECQTGCCYDSNSGGCSMNAPRQKCEAGDGKWFGDSMCNIEECIPGCCVIGDSASLTTNRECTLLSRLYNVEKIFAQTDDFGSCLAYTGLSTEGACLGASTDFSNERSCVYTTKGSCNGEFKEGYLCTSKELSTSCQKTQNTMCVEGKDQIYFMDSCGNKANIYDANKYDDDNYWEKYIAPQDSCQGQGASCGNCQYTSGSVCTKYVQGKNTKPTMGDYTCENLNCDGGRKNGESWCVYDFSPDSGILPVGSRNYLASCIEGEIRISGCADFMQEVCAQSTDTSYGFTEAKCVTNDWRACIDANDGNSYDEVKKKCEKNPQCVMFNDVYSGSLERSDGKILAGFDPELTNEEQGAYEDIGKEQNKVLAYCVPRYTPGFQFWNVNSNILTGDSSSNNQKASDANYGGSKDEASAICSLGSFSCVSQKHRSNTLIGSTGSWQDGDLNWECNIDGAHQEIKGTDLPALLSALNDRCRALGTCGVNSNIAGVVNSDRPGFSVQRIKINKEGKTEEDIDVSGYNLSGEYINSIKKVTPKASTLKDIASTSGGLSIESVDGAGSSGAASGEVIDLKSISSGVSIGKPSSGLQDIIGFAGPISGTGLMIGWSWLTTPSTTEVITGWANVFKSLSVESAPGSTVSYGFDWSRISPTKTTTTPNPEFIIGLKATLITVGFTIAGAFLTQQIGKLIAKNHDWSHGKAQQFMKFSSAVGGAAGYVTGVQLSAHYLGTQGLGSSLSATLNAVSSVFAKEAAKEVATSAVASTTTDVAAAGSAAGAEAAGVWSSVIVPGLQIIGLAYAIYQIVYTAFFDKFQEQEYYIMQFSCSSWEAPAMGDCSICNDDVRPCSEYRCKSLGSNCNYFVENGEPGYCASLSEIWSAKISPWQEVLTEGNKYSSVQSSGFKIIGNSKDEVDAWKPVKFGVITDKQAICKIGLDHSASFDEMAYTMLSDKDYSTGRTDGMHHSVTLSPHALPVKVEGTTLPLEYGDNEYYIKCKNFAGQINDAPFAVKIKQGDGPDLTEALITRFMPEDNSFLSYGASASAVLMFLNEPAECRYSLDYDTPYYDEMPYNFSCITDKSSSLYGEWSCFTILSNMTGGNSEMFVKCKDQPDLEETDLIKRNINMQSKKYTLNICEVGLQIQSVTPGNNQTIEMSKSSDITLDVQTYGCINQGEANCLFSVEGYSGAFSEFLSTGTRLHSQPLNTLGEGNKKINIMCEDSAGNTANTSTEFSIYIDEESPVITRIHKTSSSIIIETDEPAYCQFSTNETVACNFEINNTSQNLMTSQSISISKDSPKTYYIKCIDRKENTPVGCSAIVSSI